MQPSSRMVVARHAQPAGLDDGARGHRKDATVPKFSSSGPSAAVTSAVTAGATLEVGKLRPGLARLPACAVLLLLLLLWGIRQLAAPPSEQFYHVDQGVPWNRICSHKVATRADGVPVSEASFRTNLRRLLARNILCFDVDVSRVPPPQRGVPLQVGHPADIEGRRTDAALHPVAFMALLHELGPAEARFVVTMEPKSDKSETLQKQLLTDLTGLFVQPLAAKPSRVALSFVNKLSDLRGPVFNHRAAPRYERNGTILYPPPGSTALPLRDVDGCEPAGSYDAVASLFNLRIVEQLLHVDVLMPSVTCWRNTRVAAAIRAWRRAKWTMYQRLLKGRQPDALPADDVLVWTVDDCGTAAEVLMLAQPLPFIDSDLTGGGGTAAVLRSRHPSDGALPLPDTRAVRIDVGEAPPFDERASRVITNVPERLLECSGLHGNVHYDG